MNFALAFSFGFIFVASVCESYSFLTSWIFDLPSKTSIGIFKKCAHTCSWWNFKVFKDDPAWMQIIAVMAIFSIGLLILLLLMQSICCFIDDNIKVRYLVACLSITNASLVIGIVSLVAINKKHFLMDFFDKNGMKVTDMESQLFKYFGSSYWTLCIGLASNILSIFLQFICIPKPIESKSF